MACRRTDCRRSGCLGGFRSSTVEPSEAPAASAACCACGSPSPEGKLEINGKSVTISGLPLIFQHLQKKGLQPGNGCADKLLETVRIYHAIDAREEAEYRDALVAAYQKYYQRQTK